MTASSSIFSKHLNRIGPRLTSKIVLAWFETGIVLDDLNRQL